MDNLYYQPPSNEIFNEVKEEAMKIWQGYDNQFGYVDGKLERIMTLENVGDNLMYIVAMFDQSNQAKLASRLSEEARTAIRERIIAGGALYEIVF